ncbi:EAL domain-containing protein [Curvibacter sp. HBC61]|uniref:EAL domain-containing protein n=1 Tax=Curvibacter cyanobacteriorum TaxID=3026422 RepID=A0ABT5MX91_9BURK|nr:EAL domain-containing protein [Curvibacter sp. HBC61]MDD0838630.1 EAL domain-containing protein [Curvibacter sp. HBC61]
MARPTRSPPLTDPSVGPSSLRASLVIVLLVLAFTTLYTLHTLEQVRDNTVAELDTVTELGEKSIDHYLGLLQTSLHGLTQELQEAAPRAGQYDLNKVRRYGARHPELVDVSLIDRHGQVLVVSRKQADNRLPSVGQQANFIEARDAMDGGVDFVLGRPVQGALSGRWVLPLRYAVRDAQGQLHAIASAYLPVELMQTFWQDAPIMKRAAIGLLGDDGYLRSRYPVPGDQTPAMVYGERRRGALYRHLQAQHFPQQGATQGVNQIGGTENLNVFRRLTHYPITLFITLPMTELYRVWWHTVRTSYFLLALLLGGLLLAQRIARRRQRELYLQQQQARSAQTRLAAIVESSDDAIISHNLDGRLKSWNPGATRLLGFSESQALGQPLDLIVPSDLAADEARHLSRVRQGERVERIETQRLHRDGRRIDVEMSISPLCDDRGEVQGISNILRDITARKTAEQAIHVLAYFDALTGLPNRRQLMDRLALTLDEAQRLQSVGALIFIDLDHFKDVNDARGHAVGDAVLCHAAATLTQLLRKGQTVARLGGDEFVVLAPALGQDLASGASTALRLAEQVRNELAQPFELDGQPYTHSASLGLSLFPFGQQTPADLLREADTAMYQAKAAGRNRLAFFEVGMQTHIEDRLALENELAQAIPQQQLQLHLQAQFDAEGRVDGAELLLRWQHPERGLVPPDRFIPVAEKTGLIIALGDWVLQQACALLVGLRARGLNTPLSINVSPRQFRQPDFVQRVQAVLADTGAPGCGLVFEVTEGLLIDDLQETVSRMQALAELGIRFSIDDFGTGYSSLVYLKRLPLYELKIDRSFVQDTPGDPNGTAIVRMILSMAKHLGLRVVAEGVETQAQVDFLVSSGCDALQGYLYARPTPAWAWLEAQAAQPPAPETPPETPAETSPETAVPPPH